MSNYHNLKIHPDHYNSIVYGFKTFEIRKDDRDFKTGDTLGLREYEPKKSEYTGSEVAVKVTNILRAEDGDFGLKKGYVIMSIKII